MSGPKHHVLDIYGAELHLATDRRQWATLRRKLTFLDKAAPDSAGQCRFATFRPDSAGLATPVLVLWVDRKLHDNRLDLINTCAHEASHAAGDLLEYVGHNFKSTDESHAYLVGWLTEWIAEGVGLGEG